ncbi:MAG TPA: hypothetical protein ENN40_03700 [Candidatus Aminicenantes bacterium]|nr:hypothetical protein [Candidatus Aminicenantes bacterium]
MKFGKLTVPLAVAAGLLLVLLSLPQIRFTYHYALGSYFHFLEKDVTQSTQHFSNLFANPRMTGEDNLAVMLNSYGYGMLRQQAQSGEPIPKDDLDRLLDEFPDNIYLNGLYPGRGKADAVVENLDPVSFLCLEDQQINELSSQVIRSYAERDELSEPWLKRLMRFLYWRGNRSLMQELRSLGVADGAFSQPEGPPERLSFPSLVGAYFGSERESLSRELSDLLENETGVEAQVQTQLQKDGQYRALARRYAELQKSIREMKEFYKMGYPKLAQAVEQAGKIRVELRKMEADQREQLKERIQAGIRGNQQRLAWIREALSHLPEDTAAESRRHTSRIVHQQVSPAAACLGEAWKEQLEGIDLETLFFEDFANESWQENTFWIMRSNRKPYSRGSFFGDRDGSAFRILGFFSQRQAGESSSWGGIYVRENIKARAGVYAVMLTYQTGVDDPAPLFWVKRGLPTFKLPVTANKWFTAVILVSVQPQDDDEAVLRPLVRITSPGDLRVDELKVMKVTEESFHNLNWVFWVAAMTQEEDSG